MDERNNSSEVKTSEPLSQAIPQDITKVCPLCGAPIDLNSYFCPNCGKKLKEPPLSTTISEQIKIYSISVFLPPFGLIPAFKYLRSSDSKTKTIGFFALILTVISFFIGIWITIGLIDQVNKQVNLQQLNNLKSEGF